MTFLRQNIWIFITTACINLSSVGERFLYQMACISLIKTFPFLKHLRFHLDVVLGHANWANLILDALKVQD